MVGKRSGKDLVLWTTGGILISLSVAWFVWGALTARPPAYAILVGVALLVAAVLTLMFFLRFGGALQRTRMQTLFWISYALLAAGSAIVAYVGLDARGVSSGVRGLFALLVLSVFIILPTIRGLAGRAG